MDAKMSPGWLGNKNPISEALPNAFHVFSCLSVRSRQDLARDGAQEIIESHWSSKVDAT
jgi:hypothetical protein